jgi:hypothetical protein
VIDAAVPDFAARYALAMEDSLEMLDDFVLHANANVTGNACLAAVSRFLSYLAKMAEEGS